MPENVFIAIDSNALHAKSKVYIGRARCRIGAQQRIGQDREVLDYDGLETEVQCTGLTGGINARFDQPDELIEDRVLQGNG